MSSTEYPKCSHNLGFHCTQCWPKDKSYVESDIEKYPVPEWAIARTEGEYVLGAALPTKDGRRTGNGHIIEIVEGCLGTSQTIYTVLTDAGNTYRCNLTGLQEMFHPPQWVSDVEVVKYKFAPRKTPDPQTICCDRAKASNGWHHNENCKNWVLVY